MDVEETQQGRWACHRCTYLNSQYSSKCELCESMKPDAKLRPISREDEHFASNGGTEPANSQVSGHQMWKPVVEGTKKKPILVDDAGEDLCAKGNLHSCLKINEEKSRSMNGRYLWQWQMQKRILMI